MPDARRLREREAENNKLEKAAGRGAPGHPCTEHRLRAKALAPQAKRAGIATMIEQMRFLSERRACRPVGSPATAIAIHPRPMP